MQALNQQLPSLLDSFQNWDILRLRSERAVSARPDNDEISPQLFEHLLQLAALEFSPQEGEYLRRELNRQLHAIHELEAIPLTDDLSITSHGVPFIPEISPPLREDSWNECPFPEEIVSQAPEVEDGYVIVPDIPHTELD